MGWVARPGGGYVWQGEWTGGSSSSSSSKSSYTPSPIKPTPVTPPKDFSEFEIIEPTPSSGGGGSSPTPSSGGGGSSPTPSSGGGGSSPTPSVQPITTGTYDTTTGTYTSPEGYEMSMQQSNVPSGTQIITPLTQYTQELSQTGTYDTATGTYTSPEGFKSSMSQTNVPSGTNIINSTSPTLSFAQTSQPQTIPPQEQVQQTQTNVSPQTLAALNKMVAQRQTIQPIPSGMSAEEFAKAAALDTSSRLSPITRADTFGGAVATSGLAMRDRFTEMRERIYFEKEKIKQAQVQILQSASVDTNAQLNAETILGYGNVVQAVAQQYQEVQSIQNSQNFARQRLQTQLGLFGGMTTPEYFGLQPYDITTKIGLGKEITKTSKSESVSDTGEIIETTTETTFFEPNVFGKIILKSFDDVQKADDKYKSKITEIKDFAKEQGVDIKAVSDSVLREPPKQIEEAPLITQSIYEDWTKLSEQIQDEPLSGQKALKLSGLGIGRGVAENLVVFEMGARVAGQQVTSFSEAPLLYPFETAGSIGRTALSFVPSRSELMLFKPKRFSSYEEYQTYEDQLMIAEQRKQDRAFVLDLVGAAVVGTAEYAVSLGTEFVNPKAPVGSAAGRVIGAIITDFGIGSIASKIFKKASPVLSKTVSPLADQIQSSKLYNQLYGQDVRLIKNVTSESSVIPLRTPEGDYAYKIVSETIETPTIVRKETGALTFKNIYTDVLEPSPIVKSESLFVPQQGVTTEIKAPLEIKGADELSAKSARVSYVVDPDLVKQYSGVTTYGSDVLLREVKDLQAKKVFAVDTVVEVPSEFSLTQKQSFIVSEADAVIIKEVRDVYGQGKIKVPEDLLTYGKSFTDIKDLDVTITGQLGSYDFSSQRITIDKIISKNPELLKETFYHELAHKLDPLLIGTKEVPLDIVQMRLQTLKKELGDIGVKDKVVENKLKLLRDQGYPELQLPAELKARVYEIEPNLFFKPKTPFMKEITENLKQTYSKIKSKETLTKTGLDLKVRTYAPELDDLIFGKGEIKKYKVKSDLISDDVKVTGEIKKYGAETTKDTITFQGKKLKARVSSYYTDVAEVLPEIIVQKDNYRLFAPTDKSKPMKPFTTSAGQTAQQLSQQYQQLYKTELPKVISSTPKTTTTNVYGLTVPNIPKKPVLYPKYFQEAELIDYDYKPVIGVRDDVNALNTFVNKYKLGFREVASTKLGLESFVSKDQQKEIQELSNLTNVKLEESIITRYAPQIKVKDNIQQSQKLIDEIKQSQRVFQPEIISTSERTNQIQRILEQQQTKQSQRVFTPNAYPPITRIITQKIPRIKPRPEKQIKRFDIQKPKPVYSFYVRRGIPRGKSTPQGVFVGNYPLNKGLNIAGDIVDNSADRTIIYRPTGKTTTEIDDFGFNLIHKFRYPKPKSKLRGKYNYLVEKETSAIDTQGELQGITAKGLIAQRKKRLSLIKKSMRR